jgi:hypothetical protein
MAEDDWKLVLQLVRPQLLEGVFVLSLEHRLDHRKADSLGRQGGVEPLQRGEAVQVATTTPVLKRKEDLRS